MPTKQLLQAAGDGTTVAAGYVGQELKQSKLRSAASSVTTATTVNVTTLPLELTEGIWEVSAMIGFDPTTPMTSSYFEANISKTPATHPGADTLAVANNDGEIRVAAVANIATSDFVVIVPPVRVTLATTTNYYLVGRADFLAGACNIYGSIRAIRIA